MKTLQLAAVFALLPALAPAEILLRGQAKMGLYHESGKTSFKAGTRVTARFSGATDGGLQYGAIIDLDQTATGQGRIFDGDEPRAQIYISGGNHSLTVGEGSQNATQSLMD